MDVFGFKTPICAENSGKTTNPRVVSFVLAVTAAQDNNLSLCPSGHPCLPILCFQCQFDV